jgi:hypothetical protein
MIIGQRVRLVQMDGCMATVRNNIREGVVTGFIKRKLYPEDRPTEMAVVRLDNGEVVERVNSRSLWLEHEGMLEYRE